jgi:hypothetical protein
VDTEAVALEWVGYKPKYSEESQPHFHVFISNLTWTVLEFIPGLSVEKFVPNGQSCGTLNRLLK